MASKREILNLYKNILRESQKFSSYNFRMYAIRRTRDAFRENKILKDVEAIEAAIKEAENSLEVVKRQTLISRLYATDKLVIEKLA